MNATQMQNKHSTNAFRSGFSFLELQVAFVLFGIALAGLGPLVVMQSRQLRRLESRFSDQTSYYLAATSDPWARKLGFGANIQTEDPGPIAIAASSFEAHVNFQRPEDPEPGEFNGNDYVADAGQVYADRGNGYTYGWNLDNSVNTSNRNLPNSPDERYDTLIHMQNPGGPFTWEIAVPNGTHKVRLAAGDPGHIDSVFKINVEQILALDGVPTGGNKWLEGTATITVTDGRLTLSNAPGASNNKICFSDVFPVKRVRILSLDRSLTSEQVTARVKVTDR